MDVPRKNASRKRRIKRIIFGVLITAVVGAITYGVSRLKPAAPSVDAGTLLFDTVKRGPMVIQVRGIGTLVPEEPQLIPAPSEGHVDKIPVKPGAEVTPDTILVELSNPQLEQSAQEASSQLLAAKADLS